MYSMPTNTGPLHMGYHQREKTGEGATLPTYEAWTFGARHAGDPGPPGPGTGKYGANSTLNNIGFRYGSGRPRAPPLDPGPAAPDGTAYLSTISGPHHSMGDKLPLGPNKNPGPGHYSPPVSWKAKTSSWGPPPTQRATMTVPVTYAAPLKDSRIPISFKARHEPPRKDLTPAPHDYQNGPNYKQSIGPSFGLRTSKRATTPVAGPNMISNTLCIATVDDKTGSFPHL